MDPTTGLPDRAELLSTLEEMLVEREGPTLFVVSIDGYSDLEDAQEAEAAMREVGSRLSRMVRANDMLAVLSPGVFALAGPGVETGDTDVVLDRIRGVFALPVELGDDFVSLAITVGIAHSAEKSDAAEMVRAAEADLSRRLGS